MSIHSTEEKHGHKAVCPNRKLLAGMTKEDAAIWATQAPSRMTEKSRLAEIEIFFGLIPAEVDALRIAAIAKATGGES